MTEPTTAGPCYDEDDWREKQLALNAGRGTWGGNDGSVRGVLEAWELPLEGFLRSLCDWGYEIVVREAEARQQDGSAQCDGYAGDPGSSAPRCEGYAGHPGRHYIRPSALPPSAPPALDVDRLAEAVRNVESSDPAVWLEKGDQSDAVAAEYARLQEPER